MVNLQSVILIFQFFFKVCFNHYMKYWKDVDSKQRIQVKHAIQSICGSMCYYYTLMIFSYIYIYIYKDITYLRTLLRGIYVQFTTFFLIEKSLFHHHINY
jgi:hypothetical protein